MLSLEELHRYKRQIVLPEFGLDGQNKLKNSSVLIVGAGGLGSPLLLYLTAAGVGRIGIIDFDAVDETNLQRQILFQTEHTGKNKAETASEVLQKLNPYIEFIIYPYRLNAENVEAIIRQYDIIADGSDNFSTRYLINDACVLADKSLVSASVYRYEGQITVYNEKNGPCLRCLYPDLKNTIHIQSCADAGVIGSSTGVMGSLQANEVIKLITGKGNTLSGRVLVFNALHTEFYEFSISRNKECQGKCTKITNIKDENYFCEIVHDVEEIQTAELLSKLGKDKNFLLIDIRSGDGSEEGIPGAVKINKNDLEQYLVDKQEKEIVLYCDIGIRSDMAAADLKKKGYLVKSLAGGYYEWIRHANFAE